MNEIRQIAYWVPTSAEVLENIGAVPDYRRQRQEREAEQRRRLGEHAHRMVFTTGLRRAVLELHAPSVEDAYAYPVCRGCDADGYDCEPPEWPCRTYVLARDGVPPDAA